MQKYFAILGHENLFATCSFSFCTFELLGRVTESESLSLAKSETENCIPSKKGLKNERLIQSKSCEFAILRLRTWRALNDISIIDRHVNKMQLCTKITDRFSFLDFYPDLNIHSLYLLSCQVKR